MPYNREVLEVAWKAALKRLPFVVEGWRAQGRRDEDLVIIARATTADSSNPTVTTVTRDEARGLLPKPLVAILDEIRPGCAPMLVDCGESGAWGDCPALPWRKPNPLFGCKPDSSQN